MNSLEICDLLFTKSCVVGFLEDNSDIGIAFSLCMGELFYAVPHCELFGAVEENGIIALQKAAGISLANLLALLEFYLQSTFVKLDVRRPDLY